MTHVYQSIPLFPSTPQTLYLSPLAPNRKSYKTVSCPSNGHQSALKSDRIPNSNTEPKMQTCVVNAIPLEAEGKVKGQEGISTAPPVQMYNYDYHHDPYVIVILSQL